MFSDEKQHFVNYYFNKVQKIPNHLSLDLRHNNIRIFFVNAHGYTYSPRDYREHPRLNYHNIYYELDEIHDKLPRSEFINNNNIVFTQSYGRLSGQNFIDNFLSLQQNNILKTVCKGILKKKRRYNKN